MRQPRPRRHGFTLVELLVVITIILCVALIAMPVMNALGGHQVTDAARIFSGALVGIRDSAIRYNSPRGIRLLPDPVLTIPAPGLPGAGTTQLVYNRMIAIEPAGDYSEGKINVGPQYPTGTANPAGFPPKYPRPSAANQTYYFPPTPVTGAVDSPAVLMVEESPYAGGFATRSAQPNSPTNWYWNIRVGDKIKVGGTGRAYTIVGPCVVNPWTDLGSGIGNPELFVNVGPPGTTSPLARYYYGQSAASPPVFTRITAPSAPEFLFLVNGEDDNLDGYVDSGWDGFNNDGTDTLIDEPDEWETERWVSSLINNLSDGAGGNFSPSAGWIADNYQNGIHDAPYIIERRPVPSEGAREIMLPAGTVIDATTWDSTRERSRIPITAGSLYCDVMVNPNGLYVPTTEYSSPTSSPTKPFLHFWLTSREDLYPVGTVPNTSTSTYKFNLPMPNNAMGLSGTAVVAPTAEGGFYPGASGLPTLKADRRLVTMFAQSGLVLTNTIETVPPISAFLPGEGFNTNDVNYPYFKAEAGQREAR